MEWRLQMYGWPNSSSTRSWKWREARRWTAARVVVRRRLLGHDWEELRGSHYDPFTSGVTETIHDGSSILENVLLGDSHPNVSTARNKSATKAWMSFWSGSGHSADHFQNLGFQERAGINLSAFWNLMTHKQLRQKKSAYFSSVDFSGWFCRNFVRKDKK